MPKIDLTITVSVIVALAAVISPILTAIINNKHQLNLKRLELKQQEYERTVLYKRNIFENYLRYLSEVSQRPTADSISGYARFYPLAFMYAPEKIKVEMSKVNQIFGNSFRANVLSEVDEITVMISNELQKL